MKYKLKYSLLEGVLNTAISKIPKNYISKFRIWKRHLQIKLLIITGNKTAGIKLAIQAINVAEKNHELAVMQSLSKELMIQYSIRELDTYKYLKYKKKYDKSTKSLIEEDKAETYYYDLVFRKKAKRTLSHIPKQIEELDSIARNNKYYRFRYFYFTFKSYYFRSVSDETNFIENNKIAYNFFEEMADDLPYQVKFNFLIEIVPSYIIKGMIPEAGNAISQSLLIVLVHSFNWHKTLIYQALLGFYSNKPAIAQNTYKLATNSPKRFDSTNIDEIWYLIEGYLAIYEKVGRITRGKNFRLYSYLNKKENRGNDIQKANLLIIELIYLLATKRHSKFLAKTETIDNYIHTRFKSRAFARTRAFLKTLKCVVKGNYRPSLIQKHAAKYLKTLKEHQQKLDSNQLSIELVSYEILLELLWDILGQKRT